MATPTRTHPGCLILFSLPFLGIGLFMAGLILWDVADALRMMGWRSVPATITQMELVQHRSGKGGRTYAVEATYRYTWEGQPHSASRVAINRSADSFSFWTTLHDDLERQRREDRVTCWVNPGDPSQAVLHRELRWEVLGFKAVFAVVFGGIGGFLGIGSWVGYRRGLARDRLRAADPDSIWREDPRWRGPRIAAG